MMARQATAAVMVSMDDTAVFVTVVGQKKRSRADFFPLTVNYQSVPTLPVKSRVVSSVVKAVQAKAKP